MTMNSEILAALIFLVFGAGTAVIGVGYGFGTMTALGAGAMPVLAGGGLCALGLVQLARAIVGQRAGEHFANAFARAELRPLLLVLCSILSFGLLVYPLGLVPALAALVGISWFADTAGRRRELAVVMLAVIAFIIAIFYLGLGIPFRLFAWRF
jgi:hypothetical protein